MHHVQDIHSISFQINNFFLFFKPDTPPQKFGEFASKSRFTRFKSHTIQNYQTHTPTPDNTLIHPFAHRNPLQIYSTQTINLGQSSFHRNPHKPTSQTRILKSTIPIKSYLHTEQTSYTILFTCDVLRVLVDDVVNLLLVVLDLLRYRLRVLEHLHHVLDLLLLVLQNLVLFIRSSHQTQRTRR